MFGEFLLSNHFVSEDCLKEALALQRYHRKKIGRLLKDLGFIDADNLNSALIRYLNPRSSERVIDLLDSKKKCILNELEHKVEKDNSVVILDKDNEFIKIAGKSFDDVVIEKIENKLKNDVKYLLINDETYQLLVKSNQTKPGNSSKIMVTENISDEERLREIDPYANLVEESINAAIQLGASDIHYEPFEDYYLIRMRVHGDLGDWKSIDSKHATAVTNKLKSIVNMDLAVIGRPQDARASFPSKNLEVRASSFPVIGSGEKIVLRLQLQNQSLQLEDLGLSQESIDTLTDAISKKDGLILISGPTGSGKTTTLYALLERLDRYGKNISTLENPVEKKLYRINQANISDYGSFADFERALMRQDPDIILVGEVRDRETAELCMKLSATGHLVLSTIHAIGAVEVVERLKNLGVDDFSIKSNLRLSVAQRLLKALCSNCSSYPSNEALKQLRRLKSIGVVKSELRIANKQGCSQCHKGIAGRIAIIESMNQYDLTTYFKSKEFRLESTLATETLKLSKQGMVDVREVLSM